MVVVGLGPEGTMQLTASDIVSLYRPTPCSLRLYLREQGVAESEPSAFDRIIQTLGCPASSVWFGRALLLSPVILLAGVNRWRGLSRISQPSRDIYKHLYRQARET